MLLFPSDRAPSVAILVLNFNGKRLLDECLESLTKTNYANFQTYVIDNGSSDGSADHVRQNFPYAKLIEFKKNYGFCKAYNKASKIVDSDFLLLLNNDVTIVNPDWLSKMVNMISTSSKMGAVGAKLLIAQNQRIIENVGGSLLKWQGGSRIGHGERDVGQYNSPSVKPFYISGAVFLINREVFINSGGFDENMSAYSEDLDLCWRLRLMGYEIACCPQAVLLHKGSASWKKSMLSLYLSHRNFIRASIKNYSFWNMLAQIPPLLYTNFLFGLLATALSTNGHFFLSMTKAIGDNALNLNSILKDRQEVQQKRRIIDRIVFDGSDVHNIESIDVILRKFKVFR